MPSTPLFAAIFSILYVFLSLRVVQLRIENKIGHGSAGNVDLAKQIRIHANFSEYVPLALILLWFVESISFAHSLAFSLACLLLVSRIFHVIGMVAPSKYILLRQIGMLGTFAVLLVASINLVWFYLPIA